MLPLTEACALTVNTQAQDGRREWREDDKVLEVAHTAKCHGVVHGREPAGTGISVQGMTVTAENLLPRRGADYQQWMVFLAAESKHTLELCERLRGMCGHVWVLIP